MTIQGEPVAHADLVGAGQTSLHSHAGGGGGADVKGGVELAISEGGSRTVTFNTNFASTPNVVVSCADVSTQLTFAHAHTVSTSGFTIDVIKSGGGGNVNRDVAWVATDAGNP